MKKKGLGLVAGTIYRHHTGYLESIKRVHDGQIGDIVGADGLVQHVRAVAEGTAARVERARVPDAQLAVLHVAVRRSPRRAGGAQRRRAQLDHARQPGARGRHRRPPGAHRARVGPHLRPLRGRLRVPERRPRLDVHAPAGQHRQEGGQRGDRHEGPRLHPAEVLHHRREPVDARGRDQRRLRHRAHAPDREPPRRQAAQRAEADRREHARRHPRPRGRLPGRRRDLGAGAGDAEPDARRRSSGGRCRRRRCRCRA